MKVHYSKIILSVICFLVLSVSMFAVKEQQVLPTDAKKDTIHIVGHAHMDMNWLWTYFETMKMSNDNLRQVIAFMDEFPDFTFIQSQASVYRFVEQVDPPLFERLKEYVKSGRIELAGGMWTESDTNLPSGEALSRSFLLAQKYFQKHFGRTAKIGWLPDNFGHISQYPQMLKLSKMDYFYFSRCKPYNGAFWWRAPDGSTVLAFGNEHGNGTVTPNLKNELDKWGDNTPGVNRRVMHVTGVGDHGGGPTRENINMVHQLGNTPDYPVVKFTSALDFFKKTAKKMDGRPTHTGEMQFIFEGCYTTSSEIKSGNRNAETNLFAGEFFNTLRWINGDRYPKAELNDLWEVVVFNQFHDILPGSAIYEANRDAVARYTEVERKSKEIKDAAFFRMADEVKFKEGLGQPVVAYNLFPINRKTIVEATVWSHEEPVSVTVGPWSSNFYGLDYTSKGDPKENMTTVLVRDGKGNEYTAQIVFSKPTPPGYTTKIQFIDENFPAGGYKTYYVDVANKGKQSKSIMTGEDSFETDFYNIKFNPKTGGITSLVDKRSNKEYVKQGGELNKLKMYIEDKNGGMKSWLINKVVDIQDVDSIESVKIIETGPVRACVETVKKWGKSKFLERMYIYKSYPRIQYDMEIHWLETGDAQNDSPMLRATFPLNYDDPDFFNQVPYYVAQRPIDGKINGQDAPAWLKSQYKTHEVDSELDWGQEVPAQKWVDVTDGKSGFALLNKTRYGHSYHQGELRLTLMRAAGYPDIYPNLGKFRVSYAIYPHEGDWKNGVWVEGDDFNTPVEANEPPSLALVKKHSTRPESQSFFSLEGKGVYMTGLKKAENTEEIIIRLVEVEGDHKKLTLNLPKDIKSIRKVNFLEETINEKFDVKVKGNSSTITIKPHEILTLGVKLK